MPYRYPPEFRRKVLDLLAAGRSVASLSADLGVSESGSCAWRSRPPSARAIRHVWLTDLIHRIHQQSRGTYGALRVHAELKLGYGITVGYNAVAMLMRRAGLAGLSGSRGRRRLIRPLDTPKTLTNTTQKPRSRFKGRELGPTHRGGHLRPRIPGSGTAGAGRGGLGLDWGTVPCGGSATPTHTPPGPTVDTYIEYGRVRGRGGINL